ncbi:insulinase family protein [Enorma massiliensis]|uniref:insulinase family protein n=1 Tax=Enorma massiliensis TaxID=1472761 RepID=UPI001956AB34|nr:insulinase family protein [Enorma massiliensis]MBM6783915.1 insulinase family protein [Enorma massiliensis]
MEPETTPSENNPQAAETANPRASAAALLAPGTTTCGFTVTHVETIEELDADAYVLFHHASGARLLYLACDDENKAFSIGFKTPPANSTGVFHILEHSVLDGSEKFPLKEPFVELIKGSMQTFLNAMTYPDKTVYPVASTNEQDLLNLMDVYMDAVLNPAIYTKPSIFQQEGWHYELDVPEGASLRDGELRYNGVVFNEMKGALSDPMSVLDDAVGAALFPDTAYAFESGGDPRAIPELTYEEFLDTHARHYNLTNSYLTLYGDFADVRRELAFLDERYLSQENAAGRRIAAERAAGASPAALAPNPLAMQEPTVCDYKRVEMQTTPENALVGMGYVIGQALDTFRTVAADVLFDAILGSNEAPVKKAIIAAGLGGNVTSYTSSACQQPYELIILQNARPQAAQEFRNVIEDTCRDLVEHGVPRDRLEAVISSNEYALRQRDYGMSDGVVLACEALSTWLYDDDAATDALKYADTYAALREALDGPFFEDLLRELVLESNHCALVELVPVGAGAGEGAEAGPADAADTEAAKLAKIKASMSTAELHAILDDVAELRRQQEAEDAPEDRAKLPRLHVEDIGDARPDPACTLDNAAPIPCLRHSIPTRRLAYALTYFDLTHVSYAELPYVKVLCRLMQQLPTAQHTAAELDSFIGSNLGFLTFTTEVFQQPNWKLARPVLLVSAGALSEKIDALASIPREVWAETIFEDTDRMRDVLTQLKIGMEQTFITAGHQAALGRALSYVSPAAVISEQLGGVDFYRFLRDLLDHFDERAGELCDKLRELQQRIFTSTGTVASFTGSDEDYARYWAAAGTLGLAPRTAPAKELYVPMPEDKHEAFVIPSDVCYLGQSTDPRALGIATDGSWGVAANALSYGYLWNEIRVKGGAYGCGFRAAADRQLAFYTYRDPAIDPSIDRIAGAGAWLGELDTDRDTFEGYIVSTVSSNDAPVKPYALTKRINGAYFSKRTPGYRERLRSEMLATTPKRLRELGSDVAQVAEKAPRCVFGGREIIEASNAGWNVVDLLG